MVDIFIMNPEEMARRMRRFTLVAGVAQIVIGVVAVALAGATAAVTMTVVGVVLAVTGVVDLVDFAGTARARRSWWKLARGALFAVAGPVVLLNADAAAAVAALVLAAALVSAGAMRAIAAWKRRPPRWGFLVASGAASVLFGVAILMTWPGTGAWIVGVLVGLEILMHGVSLVLVWRGMPPPGGPSTPTA